MCFSANVIIHAAFIPGADPGFQVRGAHLKKLRRSEGGAKNFGVFRVKNHDFTPKNSDFFQMQREARKFLGYFVWKITILRKKIIFFPILGGGARRVRPPPPESAPAYTRWCQMISWKIASCKSQRNTPLKCHYVVMEVNLSEDYLRQYIFIGSLSTLFTDTRKHILSCWLSIYR